MKEWVLIAADGEVLERPFEMSEEVAMQDNQRRANSGGRARWEEFDPKRHSIKPINKCPHCGQEMPE